MKKEDVSADLDAELRVMLADKAGNHKAVIMILLLQLIRLVRAVEAKIK